MKRKKVDFDKLIEDIKEAQKDPKFVESVKEFIRYHGGNPDSR